MKESTLTEILNKKYPKLQTLELLQSINQPEI